MENKLNDRRNALMLLVLFVGYTIVYIDKFVIGVALVPIAKEFGLNQSKMGLILSAFFLGYSLMQIPAGFLNDKIGAKRVLAISQGLLGVFAICFGFSQALIIIMIFRFCDGIGHSGYPSSCSKAIATNIAEEKRTFAQSVLLSSVGVAGVIAPLVGAPIIKVIGWRYTYIGLGLLAACAAISIIFFMPSSKIEKLEGSNKNEKVSILSVLKNPIVLVLFVSMIGINMVLYGLSNWIPSYLVSEKGLDIVIAGRIVAVSQFGTGIAAIFTGLFVGKYMKNKERRVVISASIIAAISLYFVYSAKSIIIAASLLFVANTCLMVAFVTIFTLPLKRIPQKVIGASIGAINTGSTLGGFLSPIIIGNLVTASNGAYGMAFMFLAFISIFSGLLVLLLGKEKEFDRKRYDIVKILKNLVA